MCDAGICVCAKRAGVVRHASARICCAIFFTLEPHCKIWALVRWQLYYDTTYKQSSKMKTVGGDASTGGRTTQMKGWLTRPCRRRPPRGRRLPSSRSVSMAKASA